MNKDFWNGKKVLITGNTGFKGSWLSRIMLNFGATVYGYALKNEINESIFSSINLQKDVVCCFSDIRNESKLNEYIRTVRPEIVFHLAAQPIVRASYELPVETFSTNVIGTAILFNCIKKADNVKAVVNVTTDKVYENNETGKPFNEKDKLGGYDPYSASKACSEIVTTSFVSSFFNADEYGKTHNTAIATARAGNVIGGGDYAPDRLIPDCIRAVKSGKPISLRNPNAIRPWQNVLEPLAVYIELAERLYNDGVKYNGAYNIGPDIEDCVIVESLIKMMKTYIPELEYRDCADKKEPHEAVNLVLDTKKTEKMLGFRNKLSLKENVENTALWYHSQMNGDNMTDVTDKMIYNYFEK